MPKHPSLERLQFLLKEATNTDTGHREFSIHKKYYNGDQLPPDVLQVLSERGQPPIWENIYHKIGNKIIGFKLAGKQDIKVSPRQRNDKNIAQMLTDILKSITDTEEYALQKHSNDVDLLLGMSVWQVRIRELREEDITGQKLCEVYLSHIPTESFYIDPMSQRKDAEDSKFFHKILLFDADDYKQCFPKSSYVFSDNDSTRELCNVCESWVWHNGAWTRSFWNLDVPEILHQDIDPFGFGHPFAIRKFNIENNGKFFGLYRNIIPLQDAVNFSLIKLANKLGSIKMLIETDAVEDIETFAAHFAQDDSISAVKSGTISNKKFEIVNQNAEIAQIGQTIVAYRQQADLLTGLNEEALGQAVNRLSGYAIEQRQNVGLIGVQQYVEASNSIDKAAFAKAIHLIKRFYKSEQILKIVEQEDAIKELYINKIERNEFGEIVFDENGNPKRTQTFKDIGHFDVTLNTIPQTQGSLSERFKSNIELMKIIAQVNPNIVPVMLPLILKDAQSPISEEVLALIKAQSAPNPAAQQAEQLQMQNIATELELNKAKAEKLRAEAARANAESLNKAGGYK